MKFLKNKTDPNKKKWNDDKVKYLKFEMSFFIKRVTQNIIEVIKYEYLKVRGMNNKINNIFKFFSSISFFVKKIEKMKR